MFIWSKDTICWLEEAASYTNYYNQLAAYIEPYLKPYFNVCEIGCGLGHLACAISPNVKSITAVDINDSAIDKVIEVSQKLNITNITPIVANWVNWQPQIKYDIVMLSYFNAVKSNWQELKKLTKRYIIAILSNGESGSNLICNQYDPIYESEHGRENIFNVTAFLNKNHIKYRLIEQELEFGQPLNDWEDAFKYVKHYYLATNEEINKYLKTYLIPMNERYYLPKLKKSGIIIIDLENQ